MDGCPHCTAVGEDRLWEGERFRVVLVHETGFPGWVRVIWNAHTAELTDLTALDRTAFLQAVMIVEEVLRSELQPKKINLASLGTAMPHLHVHIIPRHEGVPMKPPASFKEDNAVLAAQAIKLNEALKAG